MVQIAVAYSHLAGSLFVPDEITGSQVPNVYLCPLFQAAETSKQLARARGADTWQETQQLVHGGGGGVMKLHTESRTARVAEMQSYI